MYETEFNDTYLISRDGYLFIENIGQVFVNGLTLDKLEQKLFKLLKKFIQVWMILMVTLRHSLTLAWGS